MPAISYQLYSSRHFPPLDSCLAMLAGAGFTEVEGYEDLSDDPDGLQSALDRAGVRMSTSHFTLAQLETAPGDALALARRLAMEAIVLPWLDEPDRPGDAAGWTGFGRRLARAGQPVLEAGLGFAWHNHDFELTPLADGTMPLDLMAEAAPDLQFEMDIGWVVRAGQDPLRWIDRYRGRILAAHIKDIAPAGTAADEDGWADVGHGILDWPPILDRLARAGCQRLIVEHDNPADHRRFATRSLAGLHAALAHVRQGDGAPETGA